MVGNVLINLLVVVALVAAGVVYYGGSSLDKPGPLEADKVVNIPARIGKRDIAETLRSEGVINVDSWRFLISVFLLKESQDLKPGEYSFHKNASLRQVVATIVEGKVVQHGVTIPEGLTSEQIVARLTDSDISQERSANCHARARFCPRPINSPAGPRARL